MLIATKFIFGSFTCIFGIPTLVYKYFEADDAASIKWTLIGIGAYYLILFIYRLWENYKIWFANHFFDSIWGEGLLLVQDVHDIVRSYENDKDHRDKYLATFCNKTKTFFDRLTKSKCSVSIKLPKETTDYANLEVVNVSRDNKSTSRDTVDYKAQKHLVFQNTAYSTVIARMTKGKANAVYVNNKIDITTYESTSIPAYTNEELPYKSEMVTAIRKYPLSQKMGTPTELRGFLCIDSDKEGAFSSDRYYICIANLLSDSLYRIVKPKE